jgi:SAM-dependent MidA family methyltransferase
MAVPIRARSRDYRRFRRARGVSVDRLPEPDDDERALSAALARHIAEEIEAQGPIGFDRYMQRALYEPGLGYYSAGRIKFGAAGDFVTAPELGPVYAQCLAEVIAPVAADADVIELGAGSGALAADLLAALAALDALPARYRILDTSADLRERQRALLEARLPALLPRVDWLDAPPSEPWKGVLLANEVVDALPVRLFRLAPDGVHERCVGLVPEPCDPPRFRWHDRPADDALRAAAWRVLGGEIDDYPPGYTHEVRVDLNAWFNTVAGSLAEGWAVFVDYGHARAEHYAPQRHDGTLACYYRHRQHADPLWLPGLSDLTAWVDFTALAEAALAAGYDVGCWTTQAQFLLAAGLDRVLARQVPADELAQWRLAQQVKRLMLPGEMGERFKLMLLTRGVGVPVHLAAVDRSARL